MSAYLSWPEARALAISGQLVRREAWTNWLKRRLGLWELLDPAFASLRVVRAGDFSSADAFASDWTTDLPEVARDVCARPQNNGNGQGTGLSATVAGERFSPPGIGLTGEVGTSTLTLHCDIGASFPAGSFTISYFLDGVLVGSLPAAESGRYTLTTAFVPTAGERRAWVDVRSSLPLPAWAGHAEWSTLIFVAADCFPGYVAPATYFRRYSLYDWDTCILSGYSGCLEAGYLVDGHITWEAVGGGSAVVVEATGTYAVLPGYTVGTAWGLAEVSLLVGGNIISNSRRNADVYSSYCGNADGTKIWAELSRRVVGSAI